MRTKTINIKCRNCGYERPLMSFCKDKDSPDGYGTLCKKCVRHLALIKKCKKVNITLEFYDSLIKQCRICRTYDSGNRRWHIDHDHQSGEFRGLLCTSCNGGLGFFRDNIEILRNAINYLRDFNKKIGKCEDVE